MEFLQYLSKGNKQKMAQVESFIKKEAASYRKQAEKFKANGVDLDKMEKLFKGHVEKIERFMDSIGISMAEDYQLHSYLLSAADRAMQDVDDSLFGCFGDGKCLGYNFH